jgi:cytochrome b6-f complex iron-sulfur subunit
VPWQPTEPSEDKIAPEGRFHCPCHGSIYDRYGQIISGPAPRPMDIMQVRIEGGKILVNTGVITQREIWKPEQAVKA